MVIELPDVSELVSDPQGPRPLELTFPDPELTDDGLAARFVALHRTLCRPASLLEQQSALAAWWQDAATWSVAARPDVRRAGGGDEVALAQALAVLADDPAANVSLAELAMAAGMSQCRLVQRFRARFGMAPHAFQIAQRVTIRSDTGGASPNICGTCRSTR